LDICKKWQLVRPGGAWHLCLVLAGGLLLPFLLLFYAFTFLFCFSSWFLPRCCFCFFSFTYFAYMSGSDRNAQRCPQFESWLKRSKGEGGYGWAVVAVSKDPTRTKEQYYSDTHTHTHGALAHAWYMYKPWYIRIGITYTGSPTPFLAPSLSRPCSLSLFFLCLCLYLICI